MVQGFVKISVVETCSALLPLQDETLHFAACASYGIIPIIIQFNNFGSGKNILETSPLSAARARAIVWESRFESQTLADVGNYLN